MFNGGRSLIAGARAAMEMVSVKRWGLLCNQTMTVTRNENFISLTRQSPANWVASGIWVIFELNVFEKLLRFIIKLSFDSL